MFSIILGFSLICGSALPVWPQSDRLLLTKGLNAYQNLDYKTAKMNFEKLLQDYPEHDQKDLAALMLGKTCFHLKRYDQIAALVRQYADGHSSGRYRDDFNMLDAKTALARERYKDCSRLLLHLLRTAKNKTIKHDADSVWNILGERVLTLPELNSLSEDLTESADVQTLKMMITRRLIIQQRYRQATSVCLDILQGRTDKKTERSVKAILNEIQHLHEGPVRIGIITSLTGEDSEIGQAIKAGTQFAVRLYNQKSEPKIELVIFDDHSDIIQSLQHARALCLSDDISVIIGPADGQRMAAVAAEACHFRIPVIAPVTTLSGLTEIGPYAYQANVPLNIQSEALAEYAVRQLNLKTFAVLAPSDPNGESASAAFTGKIRQLGGRILTVERYYEGTEDFKTQLTRIRKIGLIDLVTRSVNYDPQIPLSQKTVDSLYSLYYPSDTDDKDAYAVPMDHLQGLYMPVYSEEMKYIAPQLAFYNIQSQWLGGMYWNSASDLKAQQNYVNGAVFTADAYIDPDDARYRDFASQYRQWTGRDPAMPLLWGFDLMSLIAELVRTGSFSADEIQAELQNGYEWKGLRNTIRFGKDKRYNQSAPILRFSNGQIRKLN